MTLDSVAALISGWKRGDIRTATGKHDELDALRLQLAEEFAARHGWTHKASDRIYPTELAGRWIGPEYADFLVENAYAFRHTDGSPAAVVGHVYHGDQQIVRQRLLSRAAAIGVQVSFPDDYPSWWFPDETTLVLFQPADLEVGGEAA